MATARPREDGVQRRARVGEKDKDPVSADIKCSLITG
jgi:hypothetical protein